MQCCTAVMPQMLPRGSPCVLSKGCTQRVQEPLHLTRRGASLLLSSGPSCAEG